MDETTLLIQQLQASAGVVMLLQWLKNSNWFPWLNANTDVWNRRVAVVLAFLTSAGIIISGNATAGWTITVPPLAALVHFAGHFIGQAGFQHIAYKVSK